MTRLLEFFRATESVAPIPSIPSIDGWRDHPIDAVDEPLVALGQFSSFPNITTDAIYFGERGSSPYKRGQLDGALLTVFCRESIARNLQKVADELPKGYALKVWDAYRPKAVQDALYWDFVNKLMDEKGMSQAEAEEFAPTFVNMASDDPAKPSPHITGGAVDLTIIEINPDYVDEYDSLAKDIGMLRQKMIGKSAEQVDIIENFEYPAEMRRQHILRHHAKPIDVGAMFDETQDISAVRYFEERLEAEETLTTQEVLQMQHRRILQNLLQKIGGFRAFASEWWHVSAGDQMAALQSGQVAQFGPVHLSKENQRHEDMRRRHYQGTNILASDSRQSQLRLAASPTNERDKALALDAAHRHGPLTTAKAVEALTL